jgi:O-antigen/teichoic acid export membrane protein
MATIALLTPAMEIGMPVALVRFCIQLPQDATAQRQRYSALMWGLVIAACLAFSATTIAAETLLPQWMGAWVPARTALAVALGAAGAALANMACAEAQTSMRFQHYFARSTGSSIARLLALGAALWLAGRSVTAALYGYAIGSLFFGCVAGRAGIVGGVRFLLHRSLGARGALRELGSFAAPLVGSSFVIAGAAYLDTLIVAAVLPPAQVGAYAAAVRLTAIQSAVIAGLGSLALPLASRAIADGTLRTFATRVLCLGTMIGALLTLLLCVLSPILMRIVYGGAFLSGAPVFAIVAIGLALNFPGNPLSCILYAAGQSRFMFNVQLVQLVALVAGLAFVTREWGIVGTAVYRSLINIVAVAVIIHRAWCFSRQGLRLAPSAQPLPTRAA